MDAEFIAEDLLNIRRVFCNETYNLLDTTLDTKLDVIFIGSVEKVNLFKEHSNLRNLRGHHFDFFDLLFKFSTCSFSIRGFNPEDKGGFGFIHAIKSS